MQTTFPRMLFTIAIVVAIIMLLTVKVHAAYLPLDDGDLVAASCRTELHEKKSPDFCYGYLAFAVDMSAHEACLSDYKLEDHTTETRARVLLFVRVLESPRLRLLPATEASIAAVRYAFPCSKAWRMPARS